MLCIYMLIWRLCHKLDAMFMSCEATNDGQKGWGKDVVTAGRG